MHYSVLLEIKHILLILQKKHAKLLENIQTYIEEEYVRHIKNGHKEDLHLLHKVPELLNSFSHVQKSLTKNKQTGQNDVSLVFKKTFEDGTIKMVSLRIMRDKILSLRTFYRA